MINCTHRLALKGDSVSSIQSTPTGEFQSHFGVPPGSADAAAECKKWENLCGELLAEREMLRAEIAAIRKEYDASRNAFFQLQCKTYAPNYTKADVEKANADLDNNPTVRDIVNELSQGL
jgi:hypothetical protein